VIWRFSWIPAVLGDKFHFYSILPYGKRNWYKSGILVWHDAQSRGEVRHGGAGADRQHGWHGRDSAGLTGLNPGWGPGQRLGNGRWPH
jgi:hypothetical protein